MAEEISVKVIMLGEPNAGKTSTILRWALNSFESDRKEDRTLDQIVKDVQIGEQTVELAVFDTAGQERFRCLTGSFYRNARVALLVFDVSDKSSFDKLNEWKEELAHYPDLSIVLVGNKIDLERQVTPDQGAKKKEEHSNIAHYIECSAKTGQGVEEVFKAAAKSGLRFVTNTPELPKTEQFKVVPDTKTSKPDEKRKKSCIV
eukprot:TRINITY_DN5338_c0_g1_i1.p1 TRINITY_DN5338_c0_g1~~TRINITY_DN5338_c0_g1_i1.p1  ORF type:complete len:203 (+),score=48.51 TRINITY_DN5338_c0_g1_i1:123-731(+)